MNGRALRAVDPGPAADTLSAWPRLDQITAPALVIVGELDLAGLRHISETLAAEMQDARLVRLPGVAHLPHLEADPSTLNEISNFADQVGV
jgi:pimeloyl-ACP methyl ester carboxylesterase